MSNIDLDINELVLLVQAVEVGIYKKTYTKEELGKYFPAWNNLTAKLEKAKRQSAVEKLYSDPVVEPKKEEPVVEVVPVTSPKESNPTNIVVPK